MTPLQRTLVLFDLDGTLTRGDTLFAFLRHTHGRASCLTRLAVASPLLAGHRLGVVSARRAKEAVLRSFFRGWHRDDLGDHGRAFAAAFVGRTDALHQGVVSRLAAHVAIGHHVCVVSASASPWVRPLANLWGAEAICTELEYDAAGRFTGRLAGPNINGREKVRAVTERHVLRAFERVVAFGNSRHDLPMLGLAHEAYFVDRNGTCARMAADAGRPGS